MTRWRRCSVEYMSDIGVCDNGGNITPFSVSFPRTKYATDEQEKPQLRLGR